MTTRRIGFWSIAFAIVCLFFVFRIVRAFMNGRLFELFPGDRAHSGWSAEWLGDVDGDGTDDFVLATAFEGSGRVRVFSGADGRCLHVIKGVSERAPDRRFVRTAGDVDGDRRNDLLVADQESTMVLSSASWRVLQRRADDWAYSFAATGDLDDDGSADWLISNPLDDTRGKQCGVVRLISGRDGHVLFEEFGATGQVLGWSVVGLGESKQNCGNAFVVSMHDDERKENRAFVYSAPDFRRRFELAGENSSWGCRVASAGDLDGDGCVDILVGDELREGPGVVRVFSGRDGHALREFRRDVDRFAKIFDGVGDLDRDGHADVAIGTWNQTFVFSGRTGELMKALDDATLGYGRGDLDRDGHADLLITHNVFASERDGPIDEMWDRGKLEILSGANGSVLRTITGADLR